MANFYSHVDNNCGIISVRLLNLWGLFGPFSVCVCVLVRVTPIVSRDILLMLCS